MTDMPIKIRLSVKHQCSICLDKISTVDTCTTLCNHKFHKTCIDTWARSDCPVCRQDTGLTVQNTESREYTDEMFAVDEARWAQELGVTFVTEEQITAQIVAQWEAVLTA
jgi:hypothetical protein